ncbi:hypothetical protein RRG08_018750 [Elysia crispata]|uniref:Uncharacterized protein n=1 Tax=Elysia crispata TaxID=231223 RepID=A0AAE0Z6X7_9GAST|nr:hypothetical protein RRG08_018750 [Elysia crispata]
MFGWTRRADKGRNSNMDEAFWQGNPKTVPVLGVMSTGVRRAVIRNTKHSDLNSLPGRPREHPVVGDVLNLAIMI